MGSAGGLFPMPIAPVYAAAKAGLANFTRSLAGPLAQRGIRICALCPQPTDTPMVAAFQSAGVSMPETGPALLTRDRVRPTRSFMPAANYPPACKPVLCAFHRSFWRLAKCWPVAT